MKNFLLRGQLILAILVLFRQFDFAQESSLPKHPVDPKLLHITWDTITLRHVADGGYARMIELKNGNLITVYAASNGNPEIVRSNDKGDHWSEANNCSREIRGHSYGCT